MEFGQTFSLWCIRLALLMFWLFGWFRIHARAADPDSRAIRLLQITWWAGSLFYIVHFVSAMGAFHGWSHAEAATHTAGRTRELTGVETGVGIYFNHLFSLIVVLESIGWGWPQRMLRRNRGGAFAVYAFVLFMVVNGAIVFANGAVRWFSGAGLLALVGISLFRRRANHGEN